MFKSILRSNEKSPIFNVGMLMGQVGLDCGISRHLELARFFKYRPISSPRSTRAVSVGPITAYPKYGRPKLPFISLAGLGSTKLQSLSLGVFMGWVGLSRGISERGLLQKHSSISAPILAQAVNAWFEPGPLKKGRVFMGLAETYPDPARIQKHRSGTGKSTHLFNCNGPGQTGLSTNCLNKMN